MNRPRLTRAGAGRPGLLRRIADVLVAAAIIAALILFAARVDRMASTSRTGDATVNDGDTITLSGERIRLRGIDAPEYGQRCRRDGAEYRCGLAARDALRDLVSGRPVTCTGWERDRYGRLLASCSAGGIDLNGSLVRNGWAVAYGDYEGEEREARAAARGLWAGDFDPPHDWRKQHGGLAEASHDAWGMLVNWLRQMLWAG